MMANQNFSGYQADLADFCRRWKVAELAAFSVVQQDDSRPDFDVGLLVTCAAGGRLTQFDLINMQNELEQILSCKVYLVERSALEQSAKSAHRTLILSDLEIIYAA